MGEPIVAPDAQATRSRAFELSLIGGPWARRLAPRRAWLDELPWDERLPDDTGDACAVWTRTAFNEYASAAAFAEVATLLLACGAPIDLVAAAGDFVVDEIVHTEAAARLAAKFGGAVALEVDLGKLVRPPTARDPLLRAAELIVRTSCVGEALTVPVLKVARDVADSPLVTAALAHIVADESAHAQLGGWFLDWAEPAPRRRRPRAPRPRRRPRAPRPGAERPTERMRQRPRPASIARRSRPRSRPAPHVTSPALSRRAASSCRPRISRPSARRDPACGALSPRGGGP